MSSPTTLTLRWLTNNGWAAAVVEKWNPHAKVRQDLFGIVDILAVKEVTTLGIQCTTYSNLHERVEKFEQNGVVPILLGAGWKLELWGWRKRCPKCEKWWPDTPAHNARCGGRRWGWQPRIISAETICQNLPNYTQTYQKYGSTSEASSPVLGSQD